MPHFECGAFNHSATSPQNSKAGRARRAPYLAAWARGDKAAPRELSRWSMIFSDLASPAEADFAKAGNRFPLFRIML
jgi:hypothetical protein